MHRNVIKIIFRKQESDIDERGSIKPEAVHLVHDENMMRHVLLGEKLRHVRDKVEKLIESVAKRNNNREFLVRGVGASEFIVELPVRYVVVYGLVCLDVFLAMVVV